MAEKRLSVIIPVYNVADFLEQCVTSVLRQDIPAESYEVILVNDGSTDESPAVARALERRHPGLIVVDRPNGGLAAARNTGMEYATGRYLWFVDSDDYIAENILGALLHAAEADNPALLLFGMALGAGRDGSYRSLSRCPLPPGRLFTGRGAVERGFIPASACGALYRRSFLAREGLRFNPAAYREDVEFTGRVICVASRVLYLPLTAYYYYERPGSITTDVSPDNRLRLLGAELTIARSFRAFAADPRLDPFFSGHLRWRANMILLGMLIGALRQPDLPVAAVGALLDAARRAGLYPFPGAPGPLRHRFLWSLFGNGVLYRALLKYNRTKQ